MAANAVLVLNDFLYRHVVFLSFFNIVFLTHIFKILKGQSHHDFVLLENPMEVLQLFEKSTNSCLALLKRTVLVTKVV